jgi:hypothetical protein
MARVEGAGPPIGEGAAGGVRLHTELVEGSPRARGLNRGMQMYPNRHAGGSIRARAPH